MNFASRDVAAICLIFGYGRINTSMAIVSFFFNYSPFQDELGKFVWEEIFKRAVRDVRYPYFHY